MKGMMDTEGNAMRTAQAEIAGDGWDRVTNDERDIVRCPLRMRNPSYRVSRLRGRCQAAVRRVIEPLRSRESRCRPIRTAAANRSSAQRLPARHSSTTPSRMRALNPAWRVALKFPLSRMIEGDPP
ncbi:MAG TPA: hypothetical protein VL689_10275 [Paraburkholderia sp.]|jgi:hypothetical protein|nr:hypothetical protein [Paraburkholderia sp.]